MRVLVILAMMGLVACQSLGLATPKGFDQQLAEAYGTHTAVVQATTVALNSGSITSAEALAVEQQERSARQLLDAAKAAETAGNPTGAQHNLTLAVAALTALQTYLNSQGAK